jgi:CDGSH-type Zn-finger protein
MENHKKNPRIKVLKNGPYIVTGKANDPVYEPSIDIIQDPEKEVSAGIFVRENITIESTDCQSYEIRNRVALCHCGKSSNKPFCDATHVSIKFSDE